MKSLSDLRAIMSITDVARELLHLEIRGYSTHCLWTENHKNEDRNPSLLLNEDRQSFTCMACGQRGDVFDLYCKAKNATFVEAATEIGAFYGNISELQKIGRLNVFSDQIISLYCQNLWKEENEKIVAYLLSRGYSEKTIRDFHLGWNGQGITIPHYLHIENEGKRVVAVRIRYYPTKGTKYISEKGSQNVLYNYQSLTKFEGDYAIIVEGQFDVIAMWQMGFRRVVTPANGASSFPKEFLGNFDNIKKIYIFYDKDEAGRKGAEKVADILGRERCLLVMAQEGAKDANDVLMASKTVEEATSTIVGLLKVAKPLPTLTGNLTLATTNPYIQQRQVAPMAPILNYGDRMKELLKNPDLYKGIPVGWPQFDAMLGGGLKKNYCYLVGGDNKIGKSYFILNIMFALAQNQGVPQVYLDLENGETESMKRMMQVYKKWDMQYMTDIAMTHPEMIDKAVDEFTQMKLLYYDSARIRNSYNGKLTIDVAEHLLIEISKALGGRHFIFYIDHLKYFDIPGGKNEYSFYAEAIRRFVELNNNYNCTSVILVHTRKGLAKSDKDGHPLPPKFPTIEDIAGSHMLAATAKCTLLLYRDYISSMGDKRELQVQVASGRSGEEGSTKLYFGMSDPSLTERASFGEAEYISKDPDLAS